MLPALALLFCMCLLTCKTCVQLIRHLISYSGFHKCLILEILIEETGNSGEGRLLSSCMNGSNERWLLTKGWNGWHEVAKLCFSCSQDKFLNSFQSKGYLTCYKKKIVLCSVFVVFFFYDQTKLRLRFECFCKLLFLVVCLFAYVCIYIFFLTFISNCFQLCQATSWYLIDNRLRNCCSRRLACTKKSWFLFCLLPCVPGDHSIPHFCIHLLFYVYKLY